MGRITHLLHRSTVAPICALEPTRLITEDNAEESIHLHYRNLRLEFSDPEFQAFCEHVGRSYSTYACHRSSVPDVHAAYRVLDHVVIAPQPEVSATKFQVEVNEPFVVHVHIRNVRHEFSYDEWYRLVRACRHMLWNVRRVYYGRRARDYWRRCAALVRTALAGVYCQRLLS